jgi:hypothetical protein
MRALTLVATAVDGRSGNIVLSRPLNGENGRFTSLAGFERSLMPGLEDEDAPPDFDVKAGVVSSWRICRMFENM